MTDTVRNPGIYTGITDVYYAKHSTPDSSAARPTYGDVAVLGMGIEVTLTPNFNEGELYASNTAIRRVNKLNSYEVSVNVDALEPAVRRDLLGRSVDSNGVEVLAGDNEPPYVAIGFGITKDNGKKELWWLYKGKFHEGETTATTEEDGIEYKTPTIEAVFDRRIYDDKLGMVADEDDDELGSGVASGWFSSVYETPVSGTGSGT